MIPIAPHITAFFEQRLPIERRASENTRDSYAYAFHLLLTFASKRLNVSPSRLDLEHIDAPLVVDFLNDLETTRRNGSSSRNVRLAAVKSFMHFMEYRVPSALEQIRRILAIPLKKTESRLVRHLTAEEMQAILDAPDPTGWSGIRDRAMLHLCYAGALRVSELIGLRLDDLKLQPQANVLVHGKGRKERCLPLWKNDHGGAPSLVSNQGKSASPRLIRQCPSRIPDPLRLRIHPAQTCPSREAPLPVIGNKTRISARIKTHLCAHRSAGDQGSKEGLTVARPCAYANHRNVHARRSFGETGNPGIGDAPETAFRAFQGHRQADRLADIAFRYAEWNNSKIANQRGLGRRDPA